MDKRKQICYNNLTAWSKLEDPRRMERRGGRKYPADLLEQRVSIGVSRYVCAKVSHCGRKTKNSGGKQEDGKCLAAALVAAQLERAIVNRLSAEQKMGEKTCI